MKSEEYIELQTLQMRQMTSISCQLKRIQRQSTLIQRQWKWIQRMLEICKWLSWKILWQVKIEIDLKEQNCEQWKYCLMKKKSNVASMSCYFELV